MKIVNTVKIAIAAIVAVAAGIGVQEGVKAAMKNAGKTKPKPIIPAEDVEEDVLDADEA